MLKKRYTDKGKKPPEKNTLQVFDEMPNKEMEEEYTKNGESFYLSPVNTNLVEKLVERKEKKKPTVEKKLVNLESPDQAHMLLEAEENEGFKHQFARSEALEEVTTKGAITEAVENFAVRKEINEWVYEIERRSDSTTQFDPGPKSTALEKLNHLRNTAVILRSGQNTTIANCKSDASGKKRRKRCGYRPKPNSLAVGNYKRKERNKAIRWTLVMKGQESRLAEDHKGRRVRFVWRKKRTTLHNREG